MRELTHLDLFSGIGGFALAARQAGFRTVGFSEVEPYACAILEEKFPGIPNLGDVRATRSFRGLGRVDVLTGGFPCQPFSEAGKRRGENDDRHLWPAMCRVIESVRPSWVVGENVVGLVNMALDQVCSDLEAAGYEVQPFDIPAGAIGAWHKRHRIWVVAHLKGLRKRQLSARSRHGGQGTRQPGGDLAKRMDADDLSGGREGRPVPEKLHGPEARGSIAGAQGEAGPLGEVRNNPWATIPDVCRMVHGVSARAHRIKGLGNAIVPQVAATFFAAIREIDAVSQ